MLDYLTILTVIGCVFGAPSKLQSLDGRIVGGVPVVIEDYPYQISLMFFGEHICGGAIISPEWIVTAGHCTFNVEPEFLSIRAGSTRHASDGEVVPIEEIYHNPNFDMSTIDYDISLLRLIRPLEYGTGIAAINLPKEDEEVSVGSMAIVTGWGALVEDGDISDVLQMVKVPIISLDECREAYSEEDLTDQMLCAGYLGVGGKDACEGDSGGPMVFDGRLIGLVSWGGGCAEAEYPGVYANVAALRSFITKTARL